MCIVYLLFDVGPQNCLVTLLNVWHSNSSNIVRNFSLSNKLFFFYSLRLQPERLKVCVQNRNPILSGTLLTSFQHSVGQPDGERRQCMFRLVQSQSNHWMWFSLIINSLLFNRKFLFKTIFHHLIFLSITGCAERCHRSAYNLYPAIHQARDSDHHCLQSARFCVWQRYSGAHHIWLRRPRNDGDGRNQKCFH